ncbi:MAG TPA: hypothetical protein VGM20_09555 [Gemmatimonadales bacterium]|jgi:hypothetical protein
MKSFAPAVVPSILALGIGVFAVSVDLHNDEVQATVLVLVVSSFVLGLGWPRGAWRRALILGLMIPIGDYVLPRLGLLATPQPFNAGAFVALIPAAIGTGAGILLRRFVTMEEEG